MAADKGRFTVLDSTGKEIECEVLFSFQGKQDHKNYIVYTDNTIDENGNTKVYASVYDPEGKDPTLKPIESEKKWKMIQGLLMEIQESVRDDESL